MSDLRLGRVTTRWETRRVRGRNGTGMEKRPRGSPTLGQRASRVFRGRASRDNARVEAADSRRIEIARFGRYERYTERQRNNNNEYDRQIYDVRRRTAAVFGSRRLIGQKTVADGRNARDPTKGCT